MVRNSVVDPDLDTYSGALWIRIHTCKYSIQIEAKGVRFRTIIHNSETPLIKKFFRCQYFLIVYKNYFKKLNCFSIKKVSFQNW